MRLDRGPAPTTLTDECKLLIATVYGEACNSSETAWNAVAWVVNNRVGTREWKKHKRVEAVIKHTGFDAYTHQTKQYLRAREYLDQPSESRRTHELIERMIRALVPVYERKDEDITSGAVLYYSPKAQAALHKTKPEMYAETPKWDFTLLQEVTRAGPADLGRLQVAVAHLPAPLPVAAEPGITWTCATPDACRVVTRTRAGRELAVFSGPLRSPGVTAHGDDLAEFRMSCGSPCTTSIFVNLRSERVSAPLQGVAAVAPAHELAAVADGRAIDLVWIFDGRHPLLRITRDFSPTAALVSVVAAARFTDGEQQLYLRYFHGAAFESREELIEVQYTGP